MGALFGGVHPPVYRDPVQLVCATLYACIQHIDRYIYVEYMISVCLPFSCTLSVVKAWYNRSVYRSQLCHAPAWMNRCAPTSLQRSCAAFCATLYACIQYIDRYIYVEYMISVCLSAILIHTQCSESMIQQVWIAQFNEISSTCSLQQIQFPSSLEQLDLSMLSNFKFTLNICNLQHWIFFFHLCFFVVDLFVFLSKWFN